MAVSGTDLHFRAAAISPESGKRGSTDVRLIGRERTAPLTLIGTALCGAAIAARRASATVEDCVAFTLAAIAQNLRRLAKLLARPPPAVAACVA